MWGHDLTLASAKEWLAAYPEQKIRDCDVAALIRALEELAESNGQWNAPLQAWKDVYEQQTTAPRGNRRRK